MGEGRLRGSFGKILVMTRRNFLKKTCAALAVAATGQSFADAPQDRFAEMQEAIDAVSPEAYLRYVAYGSDGKSDLKALQDLEASFGRMREEIKATVVFDRPAVWHVYNMGTVVKTRETCFAVDFKHRREMEFVPNLDFLLLTHNHGDHCSERVYKAVDGAGKLVISNFKDNYGHPGWRKGLGGYTRAEKTFQVKDVTIRTSLTDHNDYLADFTTAFEITSGGYTIYHTGDCSNVAKLKPKCGRPDLWIVHPVCGMDVRDGYGKFQPKLTAIEHLNELGHRPGRSRWTYQRGFAEAAKIETLGGKTVVPLWGERIV